MPIGSISCALKTGCPLLNPALFRTQYPSPPPPNKECINWAFCLPTLPKLQSTALWAASKAMVMKWLRTKELFWSPEISKYSDLWKVFNKSNSWVSTPLSLPVNFDNFSEFENSHKRWSTCQHSVDNNLVFPHTRKLSSIWVTFAADRKTLPFYKYIIAVLYFYSHWHLYL